MYSSLVHPLFGKNKAEKLAGGGKGKFWTNSAKKVYKRVIGEVVCVKKKLLTYDSWYCIEILKLNLSYLKVSANLFMHLFLNSAACSRRDQAEGTFNHTYVFIYKRTRVYAVSIYLYKFSIIIQSVQKTIAIFLNYYHLFFLVADVIFTSLSKTYKILITCYFMRFFCPRSGFKFRFIPKFLNKFKYLSTMQLLMNFNSHT